MATLSEISSKITFYTGADTNDFSNALRAISITEWQNRIFLEILKSQDTWSVDDKNNTSFPILQANLVANQQDYSIPINVSKIERVEVSYNGSKFYRAFPMDKNEVSTSLTQSDINSNFNTDTPFYDINYNSIFLYPIPTSSITNGIKIWTNINLTDISSSDVSTGTKVPGIDAVFHHILSLGPSLDFAISKNKSNASMLQNSINIEMSKIPSYFGSRNSDQITFLNSDLTSYK